MKKLILILTLAAFCGSPLMLAQAQAAPKVTTIKMVKKHHRHIVKHHRRHHRRK